ncbi:MAG: CpaF family protein [Bdellovibrionia bacterium]
MILSEVTSEALKRIHQLEISDYEFSDSSKKDRLTRIEGVIKELCQNLESNLQIRINHEFFGMGPIQDLIVDAEVTEILINGPQKISYEKFGHLHGLDDGFLSETTFRNFVDRIQELTQVYINKERPFADGHWGPFRLALVHESLTSCGFQISFRRHPENPWSFDSLHELGWASEKEILLLQNLMREKKNILVVGSTGSGKTSLLNAMLQATDKNTRSLIIEDASELKCPNSHSIKLLTRDRTSDGIYSEIDQSELVKRSLRLRPDRIVMGEIRGGEAKDFLMAIATGHRGSLASIHADDPQQALLRLEMLIQMGAPQWALSAIRRLIQLSLDYLVVVKRTPQGQRQLQGLYRLSSLEHHGFLLETVVPT